MNFSLAHNRYGTLWIQWHLRVFSEIHLRHRCAYVTKSRKMVPNHTFLFHYIYYCNMNSIAFSTLFHIITWNLMLKLSKLCNKYSGNTYALVEIQLNICRNTMDFMCDLEPFSKIWSHIMEDFFAFQAHNYDLHESYTHLQM